MYDLINAELDFSKLRNQAENQNIELNQIFEDVQKSLAHINNEKNASVITCSLSNYYWQQIPVF